MSSRPPTAQTLYGEVRHQIGPYCVLDVIGHGGMATVYKAMQPELDRVVAVKVLLPAFANDAGFRARFEREARMIARLRHPHIVGIYGADEEAGMPYLVMEYLDGPNLQAELRRRRAANEPYTSAEVLALLQPLARALDYAHGLGIIHRDLKPENIILTQNGPVITDFGLAKLLMEEAATVSVVMGTPSYMAPEQIQAEPVDARSDVYALGIILYELLTGRVPFSGPTPFAIAQAHITEPVPSLSDLDGRWAQAPLVADVARRAIAKRKADRWPSAGAMVAALARALETSADATVRPTVPARVPQGEHRFQPPPLAAPSRLQRPPKLDNSAGRYAFIIPLVILLAGGGWAAARWIQRTASTQPAPRPPAVLATVAPSVAAQVPTPTLVATANVPTPVPGVQAVVRARNGAYLRAGPGTNYGVVGGLPDNTLVTVEGAANQWLVVAARDGERGWISAQLLELTAGDLAALPSAIVPTPEPIVPTAPPLPTVVAAPPEPVGGTTRLEDTSFSGGWRNRGASIYGGRSATWVYGQGSGYATMTASFVANRSSGTATLRIVGMDSEDGAKTPMRVTINDVVIFEGSNPLPNDDLPLESGRWDVLELGFDAALLQDGTNTVALTNLGNGSVGLPPFIALDYAEVEVP
jgi:predicted Ser/Thr protein kinase